MIRRFLLAAFAGIAFAGAASADTRLHYRTVQIDGVDLFYREAGPADAPVVLLLHGFPTSSQMFRNLIPALADRYRVIAPDYPGFGFSAAPDRTRFAYTFDHYAQLLDQFVQKVGAKRYALYVMDYGAPVGFRLASAHPERVTALIVQNGNAYEDGLQKFWDPIRAYWQTGGTAERDSLRTAFNIDATRWAYEHAVADTSLIDPDTYTLDQARLDRPGNTEIQLDLFYDYRTNPAQYPAWQAYFRTYQPPTLIVWGKHDVIFPAEGAKAYLRDLPKAELVLLDASHFALETNGPEIALRMRGFLAKVLRS
ncbi:alpha/beta fold hydrolase [Roseiterribacter gracilis]|uniref:Alpha/beta hydrolase n=1 Tax=Roseiterribacter gracilis TaxID=2812848 RepID=A0A8S8XA80_9PROT|nr:alpha/beta hydrolase [Rhodospirillales bacterium TMPK1]